MASHSLQMLLTIHLVMIAPLVLKELMVFDLYFQTQIQLVILLSLKNWASWAEVYLIHYYSGIVLQIEVLG